MIWTKAFIIQQQVKLGYEYTNTNLQNLNLKTDSGLAQFDDGEKSLGEFGRPPYAGDRGGARISCDSSPAISILAVIGLGCRRRLVESAGGVFKIASMGCFVYLDKIRAKSGAGIASEGERTMARSGEN